MGLHGGVCIAGICPQSIAVGHTHRPGVWNAIITLSFNPTPPLPPSVITALSNPAAVTIGGKVVSKSWILFKKKKEDFSACNVFRGDAPKETGVVHLWKHYTGTAKADVPANQVVRQAS